MKKILFTLAATLTSIWAMSQFYVCKDGAVVYKIDDGVADSITFTEPNFSKVTDVYHDGTENGYNYVDLGLPTGTLWATCNVGAQSPSEYGDYFAWGEVEPKENYSWSNYKYGSDDYNKLIKYCSKSYYGKDGFTDNKTTLELSDDAAYMNWGGKWRMPTKAQQDELRNECYWVWTNCYNNSNVAGCIVYKAKESSDKGIYVYEDGTPSSSYSLDDAHIFLPAAGHRESIYLFDAGIVGSCWSSSLNTDSPYLSCCIAFYPDYWISASNNREKSQSVRAVCPAE